MWLHYPKIFSPGEDFFPNSEVYLKEMKNYEKKFPISDMFKAMRRKYMDNTIFVITQNQLVRNQNEKKV